MDFVLPLKLLWLLRSIYDSGFCVATETALARSICRPVILEEVLGYTDGYKQPGEVEVWGGGGGGGGGGERERERERERENEREWG